MSGPINGRGAPLALPAPDFDDPLITAIRALIPERSAEDRNRGEIVVHFGTGDGAETIRIPVLYARATREWHDRVRAEGAKLMAGLEADETGAAVLNLLTGATDVQLALLAAYSPERLPVDWLETHATEEQILDAFLGAVAAAYPTPALVARALLGTPQVARWAKLQIVRLLYTSSPTSSPPSTPSPRAKRKTS